MLTLCTTGKISRIFQLSLISVYDMPLSNHAGTITLRHFLCRRVILRLEFHEFDKIRPDKRNLFKTCIGIAFLRYYCIKMLSYVWLQRLL